MRSHDKESGFALILLIGITAALAILACVLVMMLDNQQHGTSKERASKQTLSYAEAGLNSAVNVVEGSTGWLTSGYTVSQTALNASYPSGAPTVTYNVYDNLNPINTSIHWDSNGDGMVWVESTTTVNGRTSTVRELVSSSTTVSILPKAAAWTDTNMSLQGTSNIYGVNNDGTPDDSGAPYVTSIMVGGNLTDNSSSNLAYPGHTVQSLGLQVNGTVPSSPALTWTKGGVGMLSDYFDQAHQAALMTEAQSAMNNMSTLFDSAGTSVTKTTTPYTTWTTTGGTTWTAPTGTDYVVPTSCNSGNLTMGAASGKTSTYNFNKLWVAGSLTITGNTTVNTTGLYVGGNLTITGTTAATVTDKLGPIYCAGTILWEGPFNSTVRLGIQTTTTASTTPGPLFAKILSVDGDEVSGAGDNQTYDTTNKPGPTDIVLGDTWIDGDAGTGDIAVNFSGPSTGTASTVMCPVLATTEQTHSNGLINVGTLTSPMVYFMQCDNDNLYSNHLEWASTGEYFGLMILFEAEAFITGGNDGTHPNIMGAVLEGTPYVSGTDTGVDLTLTGNTSICYNQSVINNCTSDSLHTTTVSAVPGTWQQVKGT